MARTAEEARQNLLEVVPYLRYAVKQAAAQGKPMFGIMAEFEREDGRGGGRIVSHHAIDWLEDIALAIGAPDQTPEDDQKAAARYVQDMFGR
jgi:hypothetical protein